MKDDCTSTFAARGAAGGMKEGGAVHGCGSMVKINLQPDVSVVTWAEAFWHRNLAYVLSLTCESAPELGVLHLY